MRARRIEGVELQRLPRMADFARWAVAAEPALDMRDGEFMDAYAANQEDLQTSALEASPIGLPILELLDDVGSWSGTASELLGRIRPDDPPRGSGWPATGRGMTSHLIRMAPVLRALGVEVTGPPRSERSRTWTLELLDRVRKQPS